VLDVADKLLEIFATTLNLPPDAIGDATSPDNTPQWDSLANMLLIAGIEETFEVELATEEIEKLTNVGRVRALLEKRGIPLNAV
jgi:acyl carrier protein